MFPKPIYSLAAALLAAPLVNGHYIFSQLVVNDELVGGDYDYIRKNSNDYQPSFTADVIGSPDLICNKGALEQGGSTGTYDVKAGDSIGAKLWYNEFIEHPGPGMVYMSKAPGAVSEYMGDGDWFKVWESGPNGPANVDESWGTWQQDRMTFTIPTEIEDGEYLVRFEHIGIHENHVGKAQFYMECAQLSVTGGSGGQPSTTVKFPDVYSAEDPAFTYSIWGQDDGSGYVMPGGEVTTFGAGSGSSSSSGSSSGNTTETETQAPATSGSSSTGSQAPSSSAPASSGSEQSAPSTGSEQSTGSAPSTGSEQSAGQQWGAPAQGSQTGGEMTASVPTTQNNQGQGQAQGSWGNWGTASTADSEKRDCEVQYVGGSAARARRAVKA